MASPGDIIPYTVEACNTGDADATGVVVTDALDPNLSLVVGSVSTTCPSAVITSGNGGGDTTVSVSVGTLSPGECCIVTYQGVIDDPFPGGDPGVDNTAVVTANEDSTSDSAFVSVDNQQAACTCQVTMSNAPAPAGWVVAGTIDPELTTAEVDCINDSIDFWNCVLGNMAPVPFNGIDGVVIDFEKRPIDGPGGTLGLGGPLLLRPGTLLPITGLVEIDTDQTSPNNSTILCMLFRHEIGHVLGIGTLWGPGFMNLLVNSGSANVAFDGSTAKSWWQSNGSGGGQPIPVQPVSEGHWDEGTFGIENMTSNLNLPSSPVSGLTIAALADMGYTVDFNCAESYLPPATIEGYDPEGTSEYNCCIEQRTEPVIGNEE